MVQGLLRLFALPPQDENPWRLWEEVHEAQLHDRWDDTQAD